MQKTAKKFDDYLSEETREQYTERRIIANKTKRKFVRRAWPGNKTLAKPGTREYRRIMKNGSASHLKAIDMFFGVAN